MKKEMLMIAIISAFGSISAVATSTMKEEESLKRLQGEKTQAIAFISPSKEIKNKKNEKTNKKNDKAEKSKKDQVRIALEDDMKYMPEELKKETLKRLKTNNF